jgi:hypothetical protein
MENIHKKWDTDLLIWISFYLGVSKNNVQFLRKNLIVGKHNSWWDLTWIKVTLNYVISEHSPISISISNERYQKDILSSISIQYCQFFSQLFLVLFYDILKGFPWNSRKFYAWGGWKKRTEPKQRWKVSHQKQENLSRKIQLWRDPLNHYNLKLNFPTKFLKRTKTKL